MKKTPKPRDTVQRLKETIHKQPAVFAVYVALRLIVLAELVMSIIRGEYESAFICLLVLALFILPFFIQIALKRTLRHAKGLGHFALRGAHLGNRNSNSFKQLHNFIYCVLTLVLGLTMR